MTYRVYPLNSPHHGAEKKECDQCGWDYRTDELRERYDGALVCPKEGCWEPEPRGWRKKRMKLKTQPIVNK